MLNEIAKGTTMKNDMKPSTGDHVMNGGNTPSGLAADLTRKGEALFNSGRTQEAGKLFEQALELDPGNVSALNDLGVLSWHAGDAGRAAGCFERVLAIDPDNADARENLNELRRSAPEDEPSIEVSVRGGIRVCLPDSLESMSTYILLEQEDWFEDEIHFIRKAVTEGMKVIDIGANYGLYTMNMARAAGPSGRVWAFEPAGRTAAFLGGASRPTA
jgi:tetratricopeptide (TPR) repeat protein